VVDTNLVAAKLRELAERIARVRSHCPPEASDLAADPDALDLVSFNLLLAVQACLDVASHLISDENWPPANTYADAFQRLSEHGVLTRDTADTLGSARLAECRGTRLCGGRSGADPPRRCARSRRPGTVFPRSQRLDGRMAQHGLRRSRI